MPLVLLFTLLFSTSAFALVSIAPVDIGSAPGISGNIAGSISSKSGNTEKDEYALGTRVQYDQAEDYLIWGHVTYHYGKAQGKKNEDNAYAHLRFLHTLFAEDWNGEVFGQIQQDKFRAIKERSLIGGNVRWRLLNSSDTGKGYIALGAMEEEIRYSDPLINPDEDNTRINSYVAYTLTFSTASKLNYLGYYQPKINDVSDYITAQTLELIVPIYGPLNLNLSANYTYDSHPAVGVQKKDTAITTSLSYQF